MAHQHDTDVIFRFPCISSEHADRVVSVIRGSFGWQWPFNSQMRLRGRQYDVLVAVPQGLELSFVVEAMRAGLIFEIQRKTPPAD